MRRAAMLWILGLATFVPWGVHRLLFVAGRDEYALLITGVLFWVFGYWGVVGPIVAAIKVRRVFRALELAATPEARLRILQSADAEEVAVDLVASENRIPRFLARRVVRLVRERLGGPSVASEERGPSGRRA